MSLRTQPAKNNRALWLLYCVSGIGLFFYFYYFIEPILYFTAQEPVFFFDKFYFREFTTWPGGLLEYSASLLSQFFYYPWLGSLMMAVIFFLLIVSLRLTIKNTSGMDASFYVLLPATVLLLSHCNYKHPLIIDLVLLATLLFVLLYTLIKSRLLRLAFLLVGMPLFYLFAGSGLLLFALFALFYEIAIRRQIGVALLVVLLSLLLPVVSGSGLFVIRMKHAFTLPAFPHAQPKLLMVFIYLAPLIMAIFLFVAKQKISFAPAQKPLWRGAAAVISLTIFFGIPALTFQTNQKSFWKFTYYSRIGEWHKLLDLCRRPFPASPQVECLINRALCHTGQLGEQMFRYPQNYGLNSLFLMDDVALSTPLIRSDLYFDLQHFNESKHWAHEAASVTGETCWNLQRLALIYLMVEKKPAAQLYLEKLKKTIPLQSWARYYAQFLQDDKDLKDDPTVAPLLDNLIKTDFLSFVRNPVLDLQNLVAENPHNKFAADYLMASLLITRQLQKFVAMLEKDNPLPRHYQEALLVYVSQVRDSNVQLRDYRIAPETIQRFRAFQSTLEANQQNRLAAQKALAVNFSDTYWYYLIFHQKVSES
ncbi:hypothetical protein EH223_12045 [candidate division KSB1 bacterium]|nr:hypothetical protein [candidate division KSB1 bacterium]RQW02558.1 MAG: hypothetical protein EH223_12045 [candidate division KSB1 bacterium]